MASKLSISTEYMLFVAAANQYFTGITSAEQGNIQSETGAGDIRALYNTLTWGSALDTNALPLAGTVGMFGGASAGIEVANASTNAQFEVRRASTLAYSDILLQMPLATSLGNPTEGGTDSRWVVYTPSEDGPVTCYAHNYTSTDPNNINAGNNISELLKLTGRLADFSSYQGPNGMNGTTTDLYSQNGIFKKGCLVTWEAPSTGGNAILVGPGV